MVDSLDGHLFPVSTNPFVYLLFKDFSVRLYYAQDYESNDGDYNDVNQSKQDKHPVVSHNTIKFLVPLKK